jgi:hypothetical protein
MFHGVDFFVEILFHPAIVFFVKGDERCAHFRFAVIGLTGHLRIARLIIGIVVHISSVLGCDIINLLDIFYEALTVSELLALLLFS